VRRLLLKLSVLGAMLVGLPLLGAGLAGLPLSRYAEFPPKTVHVAHAPFSWIAFVLYAGFLLSVIAGIVFLAGHSASERPASAPARRFPWWGWAALVGGAGAWGLAWNRFAWFAPLQAHTFFPLWLSFILVVNALGFRHTGRCMLTHQTRFFLILFPASAAFWWAFEYLNRFVQNWTYSGSEYSAGTYFILATLSFSTVLPAVLGVRDWVRRSPWLAHRFYGLSPVAVTHPKRLAASVLCIAAAGLAFIGVFPDLLFPLLWVSPLLIIVSLQALLGEPHVFSAVARGDWRPLISAAAAALICGFFWEMWNFFSLARWTYSVPLVHRFQVFEMPVLGYAGYLPFGLECTAIAGLAEELFHHKSRKT
jgi:hypothetical protein